MAKKASKQEVKNEVKNTASMKATVRRDEVVRDQIRDAYHSIESNYITLAELLTEIENNEYWKTWGYPAFEAYTSNELGVDYRKAKYLISIYTTLVKDRGMSKDTLIKLGWSKAKEIVKLARTDMTTDELNDWASKASESTSVDLERKVREKLGTVSKQRDIVITFKIPEGNAKGILDAIAEAKSMLKTDEDFLALETICMDWMMAKGTVPKQTTLEDVQKWMVKTYGVAVEIADPEDVVEKVVQEVKPKAAPKSKAPAAKTKEESKEEDLLAELIGSEPAKQNATDNPNDPDINVIVEL